jgi:hypothetical protein
MKKIFIKNKSNLLSKITKFVFVFVIAFILVAAVSAEPGTGTGSSGTGTGIGTGTGTGTGTGVKVNSGIKNPLGDSFADIPSFIESVLNFFLLIGIPIITLAIIYSGFLFVTAQGNSEKLKKAKQTLIYTLVGAALLLGSLVITRAIQGTVEEIKRNDK